MSNCYNDIEEEYTEDVINTEHQMDELANSFSNIGNNNRNNTNSGYLSSSYYEQLLHNTNYVKFLIESGSINEFDYICLENFNTLIRNCAWQDKYSYEEPLFALVSHIHEIYDKLCDQQNFRLKLTYTLAFYESIQTLLDTLTDLSMC